MCVYYCKETQLIDNDLPHTVRVVQTLVKPFHNKGYDLYMDWFYTSPLLARPGPRASHRLEHLQPKRHFPQKGRDETVVCSDRQGVMRHLTLYQCGTCPNNPALCVDTYFKAYHTKRRYRS